jgi:hypothetical protein
MDESLGFSNLVAGNLLEDWPGGSDCRDEVFDRYDFFQYPGPLMLPDAVNRKD